MKKKLLTLCALSIGLFIQAQVPYTPFPKGDISWQSLGHPYYKTEEFHFALSIDTGLVNIEGKMYNKVFFDNISHPTYIGGIREEDKKIYMYPKSGIHTSLYGDLEFREFLLYDFGLEIGDTLFYPVFVDVEVGHFGDLGISFYNTEIFFGFQRFVIAKDKGIITLENGEIRNTLRVSDSDWEWVEGLGLIGGHGFLTPLIIHGFEFETPLYLECICQNNTKLLSTDAPCLVCGEVQVKENFQSEMALYPNPTTGELSITNYELGITNIEIFDIYGRKHHISYLKSQISNHQINISHLSAGIYFVKVYTAQGVFVEKVIKN